MIEAYRIGVAISLTGNAPGEIGALSRQFEALNKTIQQVQRSTNELAAGLRGLGRIGKSAAEAWSQAASAMEQAARAAKSASGSMGGAAGFGGGSGGGFGGSAPPASSARRTRGSPLLLGYTGGGIGGGVGGPGAGVPGPYRGPNPIPLVSPFGRAPLPPGERPSAHDYTMAGVGAGAIGAGAGAYAYKTFEAAASVQSTRAALLQQGFSPAQVDAAYAASLATQRQYGASTVGGNLALVSKLQTVMQDPASAISLMPEYSKLGVVLDEHGQGAEGAGLMDAIRAGEFRGVLSERDPKTGKERVNTAALGKFLREITAANIVTHGQIGPAQIYQFLKSGGISAAMVDDEALFADSLALQLAMGSARAGTGLQGFGMQFSAGKMSQAGHHLLQDMGVFSKDPKTWREAGIGQVLLLPGAMPAGIQAMERSHTTEFILDYLLPRMQQFLAKHYGKTYTTADDKTKIQMEAALMQQITSRIPGGNYAVETIRNHPLIERDRKASQGAMGRDAYALGVANDPELQVKAFSSALNALMVVLGDPNMGAATKSLGDITKGLNAIGDFAKAHPNVGRILFDASVGLAAVASVATGLLLSVAPAAAAFKLLRAALPLGGKAAMDTAAAGGGAALKTGGGLLAAGGIAYGIHEGLEALRKWEQRQIFGKDMSSKMENAANFDVFNRSTWADPNASWYNAAPKGAGGSPVQLQGDLNLDGRKIGTYTAQGLTTQANRPPSGPTQPSVRVGFPSPALAPSGGT